jgi:lipopolysaccharide export system protein LptA
MTLRREFGWTACAALALLAAGGARAQIETKSSAPIDITAVETEVQNTKCLAIWRGAVEALQGDTRLRSDTLTVYQAPKGADANGQQACGAIQKIVAEGHVYYVTPDQHARGDHAVYTAADDQIVMTGDVIVVQGQDVARGDRLVIKVATKQFTLQSDTAGAGATKRVRGVFYPDKTTGQATTTPSGAQ